MSRGKVYYKFKNAASGSFTAVEFPGLYLPLIDLKASIVEKKFPRALEASSTDDFDLRIVNAQTSEELLDDDTSVAKNTCVLVSRLPPGRRGGLISRLKSNKGMKTRRRHHVKQGRDEMKARARDNKEAEAGAGAGAGVGAGGGAVDGSSGGGEDDDIFGADLFDQNGGGGGVGEGALASPSAAAAAAAAAAAVAAVGGERGAEGGGGGGSNDNASGAGAVSADSSDTSMQELMMLQQQAQAGIVQGAGTRGGRFSNRWVCPPLLALSLYLSIYLSIYLSCSLLLSLALLLFRSLLLALGTDPYLAPI